MKRPRPEMEMRLLLSLTMAGLLASVCAEAQTQEPTRGVRVQGEISSAGMITGALTVELSSNGSANRETATVNADGTFQFDSATPGIRELRITGVGGAVIHQEYVNITGPSQQLTIRLETPDTANRAAGNTISLQQLEHKVPAPAQKAFDKARKAEQKGRLAEAETLLHQAVEIDPEFADGHNELGTVQAKQDRFAEAAAEFQKTIDLAPEHHLALPNLSIVLAKMHQYREAGEVARRGLKVAPMMPELRFILGISLMIGHGDKAEALANLRQAESAFPKAHLLEAQLLAESGHREEAAAHLEDYLRVGTPDDAQRTKIEADLANLRHNPGAKE